MKTPIPAAKKGNGANSTSTTKTPRTQPLRDANGRFVKKNLENQTEEATPPPKAPRKQAPTNKRLAEVINNDQAGPDSTDTPSKNTIGTKSSAKVNKFTKSTRKAPFKKVRGRTPRLRDANGRFMKDPNKGKKSVTAEDSAGSEDDEDVPLKPVKKAKPTEKIAEIIEDSDEEEEEEVVEESNSEESDAEPIVKASVKRLKKTLEKKKSSVADELAESGEENEHENGRRSKGATPKKLVADNPELESKKPKFRKANVGFEQTSDEDDDEEESLFVPQTEAKLSSKTDAEENRDGMTTDKTTKTIVTTTTTTSRPVAEDEIASSPTASHSALDTSSNTEVRSSSSVVTSPAQSEKDKVVDSAPPAIETVTGRNNKRNRSISSEDETATEHKRVKMGDISGPGELGSAELAALPFIFGQGLE